MQRVTNSELSEECSPWVGNLTPPSCRSPTIIMFMERLWRFDSVAKLCQNMCLDNSTWLWVPPVRLSQGTRILPCFLQVFYPKLRQRSWETHTKLIVAKTNLIGYGFPKDRPMSGSITGFFIFLDYYCRGFWVSRQSGAISDNLIVYKTFNTASQSNFT